MKVKRLFYQRMPLFTIVILLGFLFYSCLPDQPRNLPKFKEKLMQNKIAFEKAAETFHKQGKPGHITYFGKDAYNIGGNSISLENRDFSDSTLNPFDVRIKKISKYENFESLLRGEGLTREEFFRAADFLKKYGLFQLTLDPCSIWIGMEGGFLGSRSGIVYFPVGCEHEIQTYYPNPPEGVYPLYKLDERWFYFYE